MFDLSEVVTHFNLLIYKYLISPRSFTKSGMTHVSLCHPVNPVYRITEAQLLTLKDADFYDRYVLYEQRKSYKS